MIKLKDLILKKGSGAKYYWMDSNGEVFTVPLSGHTDWATSYLTKLNKFDPSRSIYNQMADLGWIRVTVFGHDGQYHVTFNKGLGKNANSKQMNALMALAQDVNATDVRDDSNGKRYNVLY